MESIREVVEGLGGEGGGLKLSFHPRDISLLEYYEYILKEFSICCIDF